jgi:hypothetical protein
MEEISMKTNHMKTNHVRVTRRALTLVSLLSVSAALLHASTVSGEVLYEASINGPGLITFTTNGSGSLSASTQATLNPGTANQPCGLAANIAGTVAMADCNYNGLTTYAANGSTSGRVGVTNVYFQGGLLEDSSGDVFAASYRNAGMYKISPSDVATALETGFVANGMAWDSSGNIWGTSGHEVVDFSDSGTQLSSFSTSAHTNADSAIALDSSGDVYVYDATHGIIDEYSSTGAFLHLVASGSYLDGASDRGYLSFDDSGNLFVAPYNGTSIYEISPSDSVSTFATLSSGTLGAMTIEDVGTPEPGTWALMLAGVALLVAGKRKLA